MKLKKIHLQQERFLQTRLKIEISVKEFECQTFETIIILLQKILV